MNNASASGIAAFPGEEDQPCKKEKAPHAQGLFGQSARRVYSSQTTTAMGLPPPPPTPPPAPPPPPPPRGYAFAAAAAAAADARTAAEAQAKTRFVDAKAAAAAAGARTAAAASERRSGGSRQGERPDRGHERRDPLCLHPCDLLNSVLEGSNAFQRSKNEPAR